MPISEQHQRDLAAGIHEINRKTAEIDLNWKYYDGLQSPTYLNESMAKMFEGLNDRFSLNLCRLAINTPLNRLWVESWENETAKELWHRTWLDREQKRIYKHALVSGESYVLGWKGVDGNNIRAAFNDARIIHLFHRKDDPAVKDFGVKVWRDRDQTIRAVIYYPDQIVRMVSTLSDAQYQDLYKTQGPPRANVAVAESFEYDPRDPGGPHSMGEVPVWRFSSDLWKPESRLKDLIPFQDVIDKLRANKMVASESMAFPQRVYFTMQDLDAKDLSNDPRTTLVLDPGDRESPASVQQLEAGDLMSYDASISAEVQNFFTVAHLPRHLLISPGADSSGDAIRSDEGPFQELVRDIATNFGYTWSDMMMALTGTEEILEPEWQDSRINNNESQAREFKSLVEGGMPPAHAARKAFQWSMQEALDSNLSDTVEAVDNLSDRSPSPDRTQTTEDNPQ